MQIFSAIAKVYVHKMAEIEEMASPVSPCAKGSLT